MNLSPVYAALDRGDGKCRYLEGNLCSIYEERPLFCRVDESYDALFSGQMERGDFYQLNMNMCKKLQEMEE